MRSGMLVVISFLLLLNMSGAQTGRGNSQVPLEISLSTSLVSGTMTDSVTLTTAIKNIASDPIFIYGELDWGPSSSLFLFVEDDAGKSVKASFFEDALPSMPSPKDKALFIKLNPDHFFGISRTDTLSTLVPKPGVYYFQVVYHGPISRRFATGKPAWGSEDPPLRSNKIRIEVR